MVDGEGGGIGLEYERSGAIGGNKGVVNKMEGSESGGLGVGRSDGKKGIGLVEERLSCVWSAEDCSTKRSESSKSSGF